MKTKIKRHSRSVLSVILAISILISCLMAGIIATDAAKVADSDKAIGASADNDSAVGANSYKLQTGARYYLNTYASDGKPFGDSATKAYVYCAFIWNDYQNYSIIKMDHIANTDWYTCETANGNIVDGNDTERRGDMDGICFFTSDSSSWATKTKNFANNGAFADIQNNAKVFDPYVTSLDGRSAYNNHSYYYGISGYSNSYDNKPLANSSTVTETKTAWQKTTVKTSTDGATYATAAAGDGGEVQIGSYYWATGYTTSDKGFSDASNDTNRYSQYNNAVVTSWVTLKVTDTYDGWHFMGWYDSSGNPAGTNPTSLTNYYQITSTATFDVHARFLKPNYTTATPKTASTVDDGTLLFKKKSETPTRIWFWQGSGNGTVRAVSQIGSTVIYKYNNNAITTSSDPKAIAFKTTTASDGSTDFPGNDYKISGDITPNGTNTSKIYYFALADNTDTGKWTNFVHLGATGLAVDKTTAAIGEEVTLTATAPATGTFKSNPKYNYYYTKDNSTWYKIAENSSSNTQKFYPPSNGLYTYKVAVVDGEGVETVVATASSTTTVGVVGGKYLAGSATLFGGNDWDQVQDKGLMTETSSGSGIYTKTFGNVAADTYQFRVTTLNSNGTVTWETGASTPAPTGSANPTITDTNNVTFTLTENKQVTITYNDSTKAVTVDVADVQAIDVVVYAGPGGSVEVTYGTAVTEIPENENATIKVAYGESIDLEATGAGSEFSKWYKNLDDNYKGTPPKEDGYDSLEHEVITQRTVYVACFSGSSGGGGSWIYSADRTNASPEISGSASTYHMLYNSDKAKLGRETGNPSGDLSTYQSGSDYWCDLTSVFGNPPSTPNTLYIALSTNTNNSGIRGDKSNMKINGTTYSQGNGPTFTNTSDETLFRARFQEYNDVSGSALFIEIYNIDWSKINALGVRAVYTGSGGVNYKFYYKTSGESGGGGGGSSYIPSTNFYAKDSSVREGNYNYWIYPTKTTVVAVDGQVSVSADHTDGHHWVEGFALKGSEITVKTVIPHRGQYKTVDRNGNQATDKRADEKYYVAGFSFNGVTPELISESSGVSVTGVTFADYNSTTGKWTNTWTGDGTEYTCTYKIPVDMKESMLEITPIIFVKDEYASETVMVYINGYNNEVQDAGWGNTLYMYPFYQYYQSGSSGTVTTYKGQGENFGRYPGQPIINYGGQLFCQIPLTDDASLNGKDNNGGPIKGITINNGYYDDVHKTYCKHVSVHRQTYDYDDFAKIYNEKKTKNSSKYLYSIYFSFKYTPQNASNQHRLATTTNAIDADGDASRYNDLLSSNGILGNTTGTVAADTLLAAGTNSTGWEDLQDSLGNNVDIFGNKVTNASAEPLRVFSLGYEYNNAGRWATEWAVYYKDGDNYVLVQDPNKTGAASDKFSMIVPSALVYNDKASLSSATQLDDDLAINGYNGIYGALEAYRGVPVKICYEHDIPDAFNPKNYRCDGRWTYTTVDDFVRSNIKIEYYDKDGVLQDDTFNTGTNVGATTGCSAYFTNSEYYGATVSNSEIIDNSASYTFKAENKGSYEFVGWYMYDTAGHESSITKNMTGDTPRSGNFVLAARFKYIASGNLVISNSLAAGSEGRATTYLGVTVKNGDKETVVANVNSNTNAVTLDKSYINANSNYQIIVTVKTVPNGENTFASYACYTTDGHTGTDVRSAASDNDIYNSSNSSHSTDTYTITVKGDIFDTTNTNQQNVKAIEYVSTLNAVHYTYKIKYNYTSRGYENQAYTKEGTLTAGQISDTNVVTGTINTADKKLTKDFIVNKIAPYESNFNQSITWNIDSIIDDQTCTYTSGTNTYHIELEIPIENVSTESTASRNAYFTVPYKLSSTKNGVADIKRDETDPANVFEYVEKANDDNTFTITSNYGTLLKDSDSHIVKAPEKMLVDGTVSPKVYQYFQYWEFSTTKGKKVGRCYYPEFNYLLYENYNIEAVYGDTPANYGASYNSDQNTTVSYIGSTRNQWNKGDRGTNTNYAGDVIYNDLILSFKPGGNDPINKISGAQTGIIIQRLDEVTLNASGKNSMTLDEYASKFTAEQLATAKTAATSAVAGTGTYGGILCAKQAITTANINDKNRIHYAYSMYNFRESTEGTVHPNSNKMYFYRVYSYMIVNGKTVVSDSPTYFCMYDIATE